MHLPISRLIDNSSFFFLIHTFDVFPVLLLLLSFLSASSLSLMLLLPERCKHLNFEIHRHSNICSLSRWSHHCALHIIWCETSDREKIPYILWIADGQWNTFKHISYFSFRTHSSPAAPAVWVVKKKSFITLGYECCDDRLCDRGKSRR